MGCGHLFERESLKVKNISRLFIYALLIIYDPITSRIAKTKIDIMKEINEIYRFLVNDFHICLLEVTQEKQ